MQIRSEVFVIEQNCVYQDLDGKDAMAVHLWLENDNNEILSYCRILPPGLSYKNPSIGRVLTRFQARGNSYSRKCMNYAIEKITFFFPDEKEITISAQLYLEGFYSSLGFLRDGEVYDEDGIPHIKMHKQLL
jgi:ElaA protein